MEELEVGNDDFVDMIFQEITSDGFDCAAVDMFMEYSKDGQIDILGDTLLSFVKKKHPHWAAELCRCGF